MTSDRLFVYGTLMRGFDHPMARLLSANADFLGEAKVHLLTAYVYGLGGGVKEEAPADKK